MIRSLLTDLLALVLALLSPPAGRPEFAPSAVSPATGRAPSEAGRGVAPEPSAQGPGARDEELEELLADERRTAERDRRLGELRRAQRVLEEHLEEDAGDAWSRALAARVARDRGEHELALEEARRAVADAARARATGAGAAGAGRGVRALASRVLAELLLERGLAREASELLEGADYLQARTDARDGWLVGRARLAVGDRSGALEAWRDACEGEAGGEPGPGPIERALAPAWERLLARARCERALGWLERASRSLVEADSRAVAELGREPEVLVELGAVYFEADGEVEHREAAGRAPGPLFTEALSLAPRDEGALIALFRLNRFNWNRSSRPAHEVLDELLSEHPRSIEGWIAAAAAHLDDGQLVAVRDYLERLGALAPARREVRTLEAALAWVEHRREDCRAILDELAQVDPLDGRPARELARHLCELYRFAEALDFGAEAVERDPADVEAWTQYGRALANTAREDEAREAFARAIDLAAGRQNAWRHNTEMVLRRMAEDYVVLEGPGELSYAIEPEASAVLATYLKPFYAEARDELAARYGFTPDEVRIEVFGRHEDFSVRSTGFQGFPALGVCFGPVVTAVSPVSELRGTFSWARTAFHEFSHVIHLGLSHNRCPRWITEGLATWEEEERNPAWTRNMRRELVDSLANDAIIPVRELNRAFRGPRILFGYYQGGLLARMLIEARGFPPMIRLLEAFDRGLDLDEALGEVFGKSPEELDLEFERWLRERTSGLRIEPRWSRRATARLKLSLDTQPPAGAEARADWAEGWATVAWGAWQQGVEVDAEAALRRLDGAGLGPPRASFLRGEMALARGERARARELYLAGLAAGGEDYRARMALGRMALDDERHDEALEHFVAAEAAFPGFDEPALSAELFQAQVYAHQGRDEELFAARERWLAWNADDYGLRVRVARWHAEHDRHARAAELFREAVEIDPFRRQLHLDWSRTLLALEEFGGALRELDVLLQVPDAYDPDLPGPLADELAATVHALRARALNGLGRRAEAEVALARALELDEDCEAARAALESP